MEHAAPLPRLRLHPLRGRRRRVRAAKHAAGCDPGFERRTGDRLRRLARTLAGPGRRPDHLSDLHEVHRRAQGEIRAGRVDVRQELRLCHLRGRHRYLLGSLTGRRISRERARQLARGRQPGHRSGCDRSGLGLRIRAGGRHRPARPGATAFVPGLEPALCLGSRPGRGGSRVGRRLRQTVPDRSGSEQAGGLPPAAQHGG